jgi:cytidyltransferase-like protein
MPLAAAAAAASGWPGLVLVPALLLVTILLCPLLNPAIESAAGSPPSGKRTDSTVAFSGSMNPSHLGHLAVIQYLRRRGHGRILVVIGVNRKKKYAVPAERRAELLRSMCDRLGLEGVEVHVVDGLVWRWAGRHGVRTLFRGLRSWAKDGRSERALHLLNQLGPPLLGLRWPIPTIFVESGPGYAHVSSTLVRERCRACALEADATEVLSGLVPAGTEREVWRLYHGAGSTGH